MAQSQLIDKKVFSRTAAALVIPRALQNLINVGVQSADVIMLGMVGEVPLSAAPLAGQVLFILLLNEFVKVPLCLARYKSPPLAAKRDTVKGGETCCGPSGGFPTCSCTSSAGCPMPPS